MQHQELYSFVYLISNIFGTYTIYKFMGIFFEQKETNKKIEFVSYIGYFSIVSTVYLYLNIPIANMLCNVLLFLGLTFNYKGSVKTRLLSTIIMYTILMSVESIFVFLSGLFKDVDYSSNSGYSSIVGLVTIKMVSYVVVLIMGNLKNVKRNIDIPITFWLSIFFIPIGSLYITYAIIELSYGKRNMQLLISIIILFTINILVFYLYDVLLKEYENRIERLLLKQQNEYYIKQFELMDQSWKGTRAQRHDLKNHLLALQGYLEKDNIKKAVDYIRQLVESTTFEKEIARSGNVDVDSILNYKINEAKNKGIEVILKLEIPMYLNIRSVDMVVILGNLLDNAIDATSKLQKDKRIKIELIYKKNVLFISERNTFNGYVATEGTNLLTTHKDKDNHGIGLNNIQKVLKAYDGEMEISYTGHEFCTDILVYDC
ncbi:sensor kinase SpoOB-type protein [Mobilisporobacter senegalensis]|uniref:Sensor kinase SpoOB-type protein n=1 Tax=Mobilisporobacter senegalensis TaxID=1329262 RepID=A0A3N1XEV3_9FIRM|nr:sensor histidine kinase [Mobilisporobacter senegalensis]ROR25253.1 sensor kinase SpoOB-type protein [Mobilisporobacter senegalensis]